MLAIAHVHIDLLAISKEKIDAKANRSKGRAYDTLHTKNQSFQLPPTDKRLQFVQKLRDEAHRFAISFHQKKKRTTDLHSSLLTVEGIAEAKLQKLLHYFGNFEAIYTANLEELENIIDKKTAQNLFTFTHS